MITDDWRSKLETISEIEQADLLDVSSDAFSPRYVGQR